MHVRAKALLRGAIANGLYYSGLLWLYAAIKLHRRVVVLHDGWLYSFFFTPLGETDETRAALEAFYQGVLASFRFLDGAPLP